MIECLTSRNKPVIGMAEPLALPGSYMYDGSGMDVITDRLLREVEEYANYDFDGVILQNMQDTPVRQQSNFSAVACMTHLSEAVRREFPQLLQGILINWDGCASLAVAQAAKADFIRVEHCYVGAEVTTSGIINAQCPEILQMKRRGHSHHGGHLRAACNAGLPAADREHGFLGNFAGSRGRAVPERTQCAGDHRDGTPRTQGLRCGTNRALVCRRRHKRRQHL